MINPIYFALIAIFLTSLAQLLLKKGSVQISKKMEIFQLLANWEIIIALFIFLFATMFGVLSLKYMPLNEYYSLSSLSYFIVILLSFTFLRESLTTNKLIGCLIIIFGILVYNL